MLLLAGMAVMLVACGGKKKSEDIIAPRIVKVQPKDPIRMQPYLDEKEVSWIGKKYFVSVSRQPSDSLPMVKDETGQKFVDNVFRLTVSRQDGSVFYNRTFTKKALTQYHWCSTRWMATGWCSVPAWAIHRAMSIFRWCSACRAWVCWISNAIPKWTLLPKIRINQPSRLLTTTKTFKIFAQRSHFRIDKVSPLTQEHIVG